MWEPIILPSLPGRLVAVSEPAGDKLAVWTDAGVYLLKLGPRPHLWDTLPLQRGFQRFDPADGCFRWRRVRYRMHGRCGASGQVVGEPLPTQQRLGQTIERQGSRLLIHDISGAVRQTIRDRTSGASWSVVGFCGYGGEYLLVACPGSLRLFRFAGSPEGGGAVWQRSGDPRQQQGFLRAITEDPDDNAPRLVYADWLDDHGDPERAEFIRLQCRLAECEQSAAVPFGDPDEERARLLCDAHGHRWAAELPTLPGVGYWFRAGFRGFPQVSFRNPIDLLKQGERVLAATPIEAVHFARLPRRHLPRLLRSPYPGRFCRLSVQHVPAGAEVGLAEWLTSPSAARLRRLAVGCEVAAWTAILRAVASSRHLGRLEAIFLLEFIHQAPDEDAVLALARSPHLPRLSYVHYHWWHLYPRRTKAELRRRFPAIPLK